MARFFPVLVLMALILLAGCGQVFVGFVSNPQASLFKHQRHCNRSTP